MASSCQGVPSAVLQCDFIVGVFVGCTYKLVLPHETGYVGVGDFSLDTQIASVHENGAKSRPKPIFAVFRRE